MTSITVGNNVTSIGNYAFDGCSSLTSVHISDISAWCQISFNDSNRNPLRYAHHLFLNDQEVTDLIIPNNVTTIGDYSFYSCSGLKSVTIGDGVTNIGKYAFDGCSGLTSITIGNSVTSLVDGLFSGCSSLTSVAIPNNVTSIGSSAFASCSGLAAITIPNSVINIDNGAFYGCSGLNSIVVESGNSVYDSRGNCNAIIETSTNTLICGCKNTIIPNSVTSIGYLALGGCSSLSSIAIPNSVTSIGGSAFSSCNNLTTINIPNSVTSIGGGAFGWCHGLSSITLPNNLDRIESDTFISCEALTSITIPNTVTGIGSWAFSGCEKLSSITIPNSVNYIGIGAFENCNGLKSINCLNPVPPSCPNNKYDDSFKGVDHTIPVYVPIGSVLKYKVADGWKDFVVFREISDESEDFVLSISDGGHGKTQLLVDDAKPYFTLVFKADDGWKIHSVTLNGDNVTYEVGEDGKYTTPPLTASSSLNVVYEQSSSQGVNVVNNNPVQIRGGNGEIIINRNSSEITSVTVYQIDGKQILQQSLSDVETHISLPEGHVYIIKAGNQQYKVGL